MAHPNSAPVAERNALLASLPREAYETLFPHLESVQFSRERVLIWPDDKIQDVVFPRTSVISLLVPMESGGAVEAATVGLEGMVGLPLFLGDGRSVEEVVCQVEGEALRMPAAEFSQLLEELKPLRDALSRYTLALMGQMSRTAGCNRAHPVEERCARWLLLTEDRVGRPDFFLTHEFLAAMLGVRRASVTIVAGQLQEAGLIRYNRGHMSILDREGLEAAACEDYRLTQALYERLYGVSASDIWSNLADGQ